MEPSRGSNHGLLLKLELTSDPGLLGGVREEVERLAGSFGFSEPDCRAVTRAVDEALANIIRHSYGGKEDQPIEVLFRALEQQANSDAGAGLEILLCDRGPAINPKQMRPRALEDVRPGGLGLHFIRQGMDVVEYNRVNEGNRLRMVKYIRAAKQDGKR